MTRTRTHTVSTSLALVLMTLTLTWSAIGPALAGHPADQVPQARHRVLGQHLTNHHTHMETWIVGWYHYPRRVLIHRHWRRKTFYGLRVSSQHCTPQRCWGPVVAGRLWSPHQPGRPARERSGTAAPSVQRGDLCIQGTTSCAAPWNWFSGFIDHRQRTLVHLFVDPCGQGSLAGGGVVVAKNLSARILFEGGVFTAARAATVFEGPPGMAVGALAGCMTGIGARGFHTVKALLDHLNPLGRGVPRG
jgi:hypothetical protein